eukprot:6197145-Pleurochrysis_carterae.AAC.1
MQVPARAKYPHRPTKYPHIPLFSTTPPFRTAGWPRGRVPRPGGYRAARAPPVRHGPARHARHAHL